MKKLALLALAAVMVLTLGACGPKEKSFDEMTEYEHYTAVNEKMKAAQSVEMAFDALVAMTIPDLGQSLEMNLSGDVKQVIHSETDQDMDMTMTLALMGQEMTMQMLYVDGIMYQDDGTSKTQYPLDLSELSEQAAGMAGGTDLAEFAEDAILEQSMEDVENGKKLIFTLDPAKTSAMFESITSGVTENLTAGAEVDLSVESLTYEMTIDREHNLKDMHMLMDMTMAVTVEGETVTMGCDMDMNYTVTGFDTVAEIAAPADADSYTATEAPGSAPTDVPAGAPSSSVAP